MSELSPLGYEGTGAHRELCTPVEKYDACDGATPSLLDRVQLLGRVKEVGRECHREPPLQVGKWGGRRGENIEEGTCDRCSRYSVSNDVRDADENLVLSRLLLVLEDEEARDEVMVLSGLVALEHPYVCLNFLAGLCGEEVDLVRMVAAHPDAVLRNH